MVQRVPKPWYGGKRRDGRSRSPAEKEEEKKKRGWDAKKGPAVARWRREGKGGRGMRRLLSGESSPSQSIRMGLTGAPLLALTRFVFVLVRVAWERERSRIFSRRAENTHTYMNRVSHVKVDDGAENVSVIDTCFSRGASRSENSSSGKRVLFVALLAKERGIGERYVRRDSLDKAQRNPYYGNEKIRG